MTDQEIFDKVARAIKAQGRGSSSGGYCRYRGPDGTKCAAGHLIPDEMYSPSMESQGVKMLRGTYYKLPWDESQDGLVANLQFCHDNAVKIYPQIVGFMATFLCHMRTVANERGLDPKVLDE